MVFRKKGIKSRWGGPRSKFLVSLNFFIEILWKKIFGVGDPKNRRFWGFFQKSIPEISASWEKTCFLCCRFFWKIEEMEGYFGGCAPNFFLQKLSNIARFQFKNERDRRRTRGVTAVYFSVFILSQHGKVPYACADVPDVCTYHFLLQIAFRDIFTS